jgi:hypothetical protein
MVEVRKDLNRSVTLLHDRNDFVLRGPAIIVFL